MDKEKKNKGESLPSSKEIAEVYRSLNLSGMLSTSYSWDQQLAVFRKLSLYTDDSPCYATGNTIPYHEGF